MAFLRETLSLPPVKEVLLWGKIAAIQKRGSGERENFLIDVTFSGSLVYNAPPRPRRNHWYGAGDFLRHHHFGKAHGTVRLGPRSPHKSGRVLSLFFSCPRTNGFCGGAGEHCILNFPKKARQLKNVPALNPDQNLFRKSFPRPYHLKWADVWH